MSETLRIGAQIFHKTDGVFRVPLADLSSVRFTQVPYYSTREVSDLPGSQDTYTMSVSATHAGGSHNENFSLSIHINFDMPGSTDDSQRVSSCNRRKRHVTRFFQQVASEHYFRCGPDMVPFFEGDGQLLCIVGYSRTFKREDPILFPLIQPFVARFVELLKTRDTLLFLCHASEDKPFVDRLCAFFDAQQVPVWYDRREIKVGESIVRRISDGLGTASHLVIVLSRASVTKEWVLKEMSAALMRQLQTSAIRVLPVLIETCAIPSHLVRHSVCRLPRGSE